MANATLTTPEQTAIIVKIAVMCHGNNEGDELTPLGEKQVTAAVKNLIIKRGFSFGHIAHSLTVVARQCADIAQATIKDHHFFVYREIEGLSVKNLLVEVFEGDMEAYEKDLQEIVEAGNTVAVALQRSAYADLAHFQLSKYLFGLAEEIANLGEKDLGRKEALCFSQSSFHTLAVPEKWAAFIKYGAPEASTVIYTIQDGSIINVELILAPPVK